MFRRKNSPRHLVAMVALLVAVGPARAQHGPTPPRDFLGFDLGDDYRLATYGQLWAWWDRLDAESDRLTVEVIGRTEEGRDQVMAVVTSPENHRRLGRYREIARRLALAEGLTDDQARSLAAEGKAVVWIDGGLHASETLGAQQLMELVWQMVSRDDEETLRFLDDVILLAVHANPDGHDLVANWYMRIADETKRSLSGVPVLYQKYAGHDNNRDFYMSTQAETVNMNRVMYREWFPQIVYNHHQSGPAGTVMFAPPFRDPFNYSFHPLLPLSIEAVGTALHARLVAEGKGGTTMRSGGGYSTWWNGGLRTTPYFHNMIGLLTETIGNPTPSRIPLVLSRQLPRNDAPLPIEPQEWHFRQSIEYSQTANRAVLNYASRNRADLLYNIYVMGRDNIAKGQNDSWRADPSVILKAEQFAREIAPPPGARGAQRFGSGSTPDTVFTMAFRNPALRDPRGYVIPSDQADFPTAVKFVNTLARNGIAIHRATRRFVVEGREYAAGSFVVFTAQAARPFVLDLFEPQVHPNDFAYPGGPPIAPYDNTGWTVAYQMGVAFDRILDGFDGPFERVDGLAGVPEGSFASGRAGYLLDHSVNDVFVATNRLLREGFAVHWLSESIVAAGREWPAGTVWVPASDAAARRLDALAGELGLMVVGVDEVPGVEALRMRAPRVGLWDRYGGSMPSGWTRWVLEQFDFAHEVVFSGRLDAGDLKRDFDVLIFPDGAIPADSTSGAGRQPDPEDIPEEYRDRLGSVTVQTTVPRLMDFLEAGGSIVTIGNSTRLARHVGLKLDDWLVDHSGISLARDEYYVPGSILRIALDPSLPVAWGLGRELDIAFDNSPVFGLPAEAESAGVVRVGWFDRREPLRSGWAWGQHWLNGGVTLAEAPVGAGRLYLFGPGIVQRGQPHGTFKLLFNAIYLGAADEAQFPGEGVED